jgi:hypothetical protein
VVHSKNILALPRNIRLRPNCLPVTNALAYYAKVLAKVLVFWPLKVMQLTLKTMTRRNRIYQVYKETKFLHTILQDTTYNLHLTKYRKKYKSLML